MQHFIYRTSCISNLLGIARLVRAAAWRQQSSGYYAASGDEDGKRRIIFLGTPEVSARVLRDLLEAASRPGSTFEVAAVISRPIGIGSSLGHSTPTTHSATHSREQAGPGRPDAGARRAPDHRGTGPSSGQQQQQQQQQQHTCTSAPHQQHAGQGLGNSHNHDHHHQQQQQQPQAHRQQRYGEAGRGGTSGHTVQQPSPPSTPSSPSTSASSPPSSSSPLLAHASPPAGKVQLSPTERTALEWGLTPDRILRPASAKEASFLDAVRSLRPHLAVTAAYGAMLPSAFLELPTRGTVNIHPSLLPKYRGAAPVQRALQDGCAVTGVSLAFTVLKCDAGPVVAQQEVAVDPAETAPKLTARLFGIGSQLLLRHLPGLLDGTITPQHARQQDESEATHAPKVLRQEGYVDFNLPAQAVHNHVRAMAGWPGARARLLVSRWDSPDERDPLEIKLVRTAVVPWPGPTWSWAGSPLTRYMHHHDLYQKVQQGQREPPTGPYVRGQLWFPDTAARVLYDSATGELLVPCGDGSFLQILEVGRRRGAGVGSGAALTARGFMDGLRQRKLYVPWHP